MNTVFDENPVCRERESSAPAVGVLEYLDIAWHVSPVQPVAITAAPIAQEAKDFVPLAPVSTAAPAGPQTIKYI